jgi:hypothetical protein
MKGKAAERSDAKPQAEAKANGGDPIEVSAQTMLAAESLRGDVAERIHEFVTGLKKLYAGMTEDEQEEFIKAEQQLASFLVIGAVRLVAAEGHQNMPIRLGKKFSVTRDIEKGKAIQYTFSMPYSLASLAEIGERMGSEVLMVPVSLEEFMGERSKIEPDVVGPLRMHKTPPPAAPTPPHDPETGEIRETA